MEQEAPTTNLDRTLERVRKLIALAEHPETPPSEAMLAQRQADALMLKFSIDAAKINAARPAADKNKPKILTVQLGPQSDVLGYIAQVCMDIAEHCSCKTRLYSSWADGSWLAKVYGFEGEVRYFELLYTTVRLNMISALLPKLETHKSLEDNAYRLHSAGYNWLQIAEMYGWKKYSHTRASSTYGGTYPPADLKVPYWHAEHGWQSATQVGSRIKRACEREAKRRGEAVQKIAANGSDTYRRSAAAGYTARLRQRLASIARQRSASDAVILRSQVDDLDALFREDNPDLFTVRDEEPSSDTPTRTRKLRYRPVNLDAYDHGVRTANTADLNATTKMGGSMTREIG